MGLCHNLEELTMQFFADVHDEGRKGVVMYMIPTLVQQARQSLI